MGIFPTRVMLVDTGERRHPNPGEIYYFDNPTLGVVYGPWIYDEETQATVPEWTTPGEFYAIYRVEPIDS